MADYTLYYWPIPFRGQFVRAVLAHVQAEWEEVGVDELIAQKDLAPNGQLVPHMGPPVLVDHEANIQLSQMPAILAYLGKKHELIGTNALQESLCNKIIADANDVLYEMTRYNGEQMWTKGNWNEFLPRLKRWMTIFEETGRRNGLTAEHGNMLGTPSISLADLVTSILWGTMTSKLQTLRPTLNSSAPGVANLTDRIAQLPEQIKLRERSDNAYGDEWCSGQIEASLRAVL